jgi:argininosuccinate synthase
LEEATVVEPVNAKRVVLAYSGGLDTSVAVRWIQKEWGAEVVAMAVDVGQVPDADEAYWEATRQRAFAAGAIEALVVDARAEYATEYIAKAIKANALYEGKYPLVSALSRPVIARHLVAAAREHGADAVAHGCTGKGNDQVRFEVSIRALAPDLNVLAPVRVWGFSRQDSIEYAAAHDIPITVTEDKPYSIDENIVGRAIECGEMEDPWVAPPEDVYEITRAVADAPRESLDIVLRFERGVPVALDGAELPLHEILYELNPIVGAYGFGRLDMVENRRVGIKSRETYECPGILALMLAHADLESITLERDVMREKSRLEPRYSELVYDGLWFSPLREAFDAFIDSTQRHVTGEVRLRLEPGRCFVSGRRADHGLYDYDLATYESGDAFRHEDAAGFVRLWGLSVETWSRRQRNEEPAVRGDGQDPGSSR